jgi:hypothetical protein
MEPSMSSIIDDTEPRRLSIEERLEPKLKDAEYLLVLVLAFMLWTAGFVDLFTHSSQTKTVFGLYSIPYFLVLVLYSLGFLFWGWLIFPARSIDRFKAGLLAIQNRTWLALLVFIGFGALLSSMYLVERWVTFPLLEASLAILTLIAASVLIWSKPDGKPRTQKWRIILGWFVISLLIVEIVLQSLSFIKVLPIENASGMFTPYGRVYQNQEGHTNTKTNRLGWYYPDFVQANDSYRIIFTGDTYLQGIQVPPEENVGMRVQEKLAQGSSMNGMGNTEVIGMGLPGYGPGLYLDTLLIPYTINPIQPEEVVVFFHLANDFQVSSAPGGEIPYYILNEKGETVPHPEDLVLRHDLQHIIIRGYEPINPVGIASTHLFLFNLFDGGLRNILNERQHVPIPALNISTATHEKPFGAASFMFRNHPDSLHAQKIAIGLLDSFRKELAVQGIELRLVTIPYFPQAFYEQNQGGNWSSQIGDYDLLLPDRALKEFTEQNQVPFLSLGTYYQAAGISVEEIQSFFYNNGTGHFTAAGHEAAAQAVYECFYQTGSTCPGH